MGYASMGHENPRISRVYIYPELQQIRDAITKGNETLG